MRHSGCRYRFGVQVWLVALAVVVAASLVAQLLGPAQGVIRRDLLPPELRERAVALGQFSRSTVLLIAPALAAPVFAAFGIAWALVINGVSFFVAVVFLRLAMRMAWRHPSGATDGAGRMSRRRRSSRTKHGCVETAVA